MRQESLAGCLYGFNSAAERRTVIFMLWEELKKIITLKKILFFAGGYISLLFVISGSLCGEL